MGLTCFIFRFLRHPHAGRNLFTTIKGKTPATWVTWFWLGVWAVAVVVVSVVCQTRIWAHMVARANYMPHGQETVIRGTEVVGGSNCQDPPGYKHV